MTGEVWQMFKTAESLLAKSRHLPFSFIVAKCEVGVGEEGREGGGCRGSR